VVAYGDEWLPEPEAGLAKRIRELRDRTEAAGGERRVTGRVGELASALRV
jgi:hypothetical protein